MEVISPEKLKQYTQLELQNLNARLHAYWRDMESGEKDYNREELVNQYVWVLGEMRSRDMKHKVRDQLDVEALTLLNKNRFPLWLTVFPSSESKTIIYEVQDALGLERTDSNDEDSLHITLQLFNDISSVDKIQSAIKERVSDSDLFFKVDGLDIFGDKEKVVVLTGTIPPCVSDLVEFLREEFPECHKKFEFNPHITLGKAENFDLPTPEYWDSLNGVIIKLDKPMLLVSLEKEQTFELSYIPEDENKVEEEIYQNLEAEINKRLDPNFSEALNSISDLVVVADIVSVSGSSVDPNNEDPQDIDLVWRIDWEEGEAKIDLRNLLMKFDRAFPRTIQDKFEHISSPQGPNWSSIPLADLVLRFHSKHEPKYLDESYAYYKSMGDVAGAGQEWISEEWYDPEHLKEKFKEYIDKCEDIDNVNWEDLFEVFVNLLRHSFDKQKKGKEVELMKPFDALKSKAGYHKNEFFVGEEEDVWRIWASPHLLSKYLDPDK